MGHANKDMTIVNTMNGVRFLCQIPITCHSDRFVTGPKRKLTTRYKACILFISVCSLIPSSPDMAMNKWSLIYKEGENGQ